MIALERLAVPQADRYDTKVVLERATTVASPRRPLYVPRPVEGHPTIFDGQVAVRESPRTQMLPPAFVSAPAEHPNLDRAARYVQRWPEVYDQFKALMDTVTPLYDGNTSPQYRGNLLGSCSHSEEECFGAMMATVEDPLGLAQAMVHEMAHQKLRALGVSVEVAERFIVNDPAELYPSPVRFDRPRPMTAIFHAVYSFIHVTALDLKMIAEEEDAAVVDRMVMLLARNVPRMTMGREILGQSLRTDADGGRFCEPFLAWTDEVLREGERVLERFGYGIPGGDHERDGAQGLASVAT